MNERMQPWMQACMGAGLRGLMDGRMDGWIDGWIGGWTKYIMILNTLIMNEEKYTYSKCVYIYNMHTKQNT